MIIGHRPAAWLGINTGSRAGTVTGVTTGGGGWREDGGHAAARDPLADRAVVGVVALLRLGLTEVGLASVDAHERAVSDLVDTLAWLEGTRSGHTASEAGRVSVSLRQEPVASAALPDRGRYVNPTFGYLQWAIQGSNL